MAKKVLLIIIKLCIIVNMFSSQAISHENRIEFPADIELKGPAGVLGLFDIKDSKYYPRFDFYNMKSEGSLILIEKFMTFQQTTEVTCGPATIVMLLQHYGKYDGQGDRLMHEMRENKEKPEVTLRDMINMLNTTGDWDIYSTYDLDDPYHIPKELLINSLKEGKPIIIGDNEWGGHWRIIIGFDDMGDDIEANDVFILAEPYDTTDHFQDGYTIIPFQRLYYNWSNRFDPDFSHNLFLIGTPK